MCSLILAVSPAASTPHPPRRTSRPHSSSCTSPTCSRASTPTNIRLAWTSSRICSRVLWRIPSTNSRGTSTTPPTATTPARASLTKRLSRTLPSQPCRSTTRSSSAAPRVSSSSSLATSSPKRSSLSSRSTSAASRRAVSSSTGWIPRKNMYRAKSA